EVYVLDILRNDGSLARSLNATQPSALYAAADETADFGGPQTAIEAAVAQVGTLAGRSPATRARLPVRRA
ncbi:hypothetical protein, partial [Methylobacterium haplocladii]